MMNTILLLGWVSLIVVTYLLAVKLLKKANLYND